MKIVSNIDEWKKIRATIQNKNIGFVPTMGNLHEGHLYLCKQAKENNDIVVVSIFVNPTQFNQKNDFEHYPRTIEDDIKKITSYADYVFIPEADAMYQDNFEIKIVETSLSSEAEGEYRPGHFTGMLTIVLKLFNLVQPNQAYFGEKDYQQLLLIKKMIAALFIPIEIIACKTQRAEDGLALSSRNSRLTEKQRKLAVHFPLLLQSKLPLKEIKEKLTALGFRVDYVIEKWQRRLGAVWLGDVRLIDNIPL